MKSFRSEQPVALSCGCRAYRKRLVSVLPQKQYPCIFVNGRSVITWECRFKMRRLSPFRTLGRLARVVSGSTRDTSEACSDSQVRQLRELTDRYLDDRASIQALLPEECTGIELGVAGAGYADRLLSSHPGLYLFGVDAYAGDRFHDSEQYRHALKVLLRHRPRSTLIRLRFEEAVEVFTDDFFDFVYIDGYAHTGQEGGKTLWRWWPKAKGGAVFAGDDYSPEWPLTREVVDDFAATLGLPLFTISNAANAELGEFTNWFVVKPATDGNHLLRIINNLRSRLNRLGRNWS